MSSSSSHDESDPTYVVVFAHPDDESMFFLPTIRWLVDHQQAVWFLSLTNGNYDGLGSVRESELKKAGQLLGASKVIVRNDNTILDHPQKRYDKTTVANAIRDSLSKHASKDQTFVLITFDELGVSGHVNHTDVYHGVVHLMETNDNSIQLKEAWYLESERNMLAKYVPVVSWMLLFLALLTSTFQSTTTDSSTTKTFRMHEPVLNWKAMATHRSQFVWYRRLFVVFSSYTYYNKLKCIPSKPQKKID